MGILARVRVIRTEHNGVRTKTTKDQYCLVQLEQANVALGRCSGHARAMLACLNLLVFENRTYTYGKLPTKKELIRILGFTKIILIIHCIHDN